MSESREQAERYEREIDVEAIRKGDVIPRSKIASLHGIPYRSSNERRIETAGVAFRTWLERRLHEIHGVEWTVIEVQGDTRILTDSEALLYHRKFFKKHMRGARRNTRKLADVDSDSLTFEEQQERDRAVWVQKAMLAGAASARREATRKVATDESP